MTASEAAILCLVATVGHLMALFWLVVEQYEINLGRDRIYDLEIRHPQVRRELKNSLHTPLHAVMLMIALLLGLFGDRSGLGFIGSLLLTALWAEIWHYTSHRAFHWQPLHWIHAEHHKSRLSSPFTALSFSFMEKFIFDIGMIGAMALVDQFILSLNFFGIVTWFVLYLIINSYGHANYEIRSPSFMKFTGIVITSTVYHSLHHSRYTGNYGLGTRVLDRLFGTEWPDSEAAFEQVVVRQTPFDSLRSEARNTDET